MKFAYKLGTYKLTFERAHRNITLIRAGRVKPVKSRHPYTTAKLYYMSSAKDPVVVATASVGCAKNDTYSKELGRLYALKALSANLRKNKQPKELTAAMWKAYIERGSDTPDTPASGTPSDVQLSVTNPQLALPPATEKTLVEEVVASGYMDQLVAPATNTVH